MKGRITRIAFKIHGWVGLTAGIFMLLFGLTGSMLMFRHELDRYCNSDLHKLQPGVQYVPVDSIYRILTQKYPNLKKIVLHDLPQNRYDCYEFMLYKNQQQRTANYLYCVWVNPYNGSILREGSYQHVAPSFFRWLYSFHYSLQLGMPGKLLAAIIALLMLVSLFTGAIVYRKHFWSAFRFRAGLNFKNRRTAISSLHRIIGVWALVFNVLLFFTGFWMNKEMFTAAAWSIKPPVINKPVPANIDSVLAIAKTIKEFTPIAVNIPVQPGQDISVRGHFSTTTSWLLQGKASGIAFDATTGHLKEIAAIDKKDWSQRMDWMIYQFHIGNYGGNLIRWLYVILGLTPALLSITGALLWLRRKR